MDRGVWWATRVVKSQTRQATEHDLTIFRLSQVCEAVNILFTLASLLTSALEILVFTYLY